MLAKKEIKEKKTEKKETDYQIKPRFVNI